MAEVLLYNISEDYDLEKFEELARTNDIEIKMAYKDDIDQYVGYLIGSEGYERNDQKLDFDETLDFPFILFVQFESQQLFDFLDQIRDSGLAIQHKAGETANNVKWTLRELLLENDKEAKMMGLIHRINALLDRAEVLKEAHGPDPVLKELIPEMQEYFNNSTIFELDVAQRYYLRLLDEILRVEEEHKED